MKNLLLVLLISLCNSVFSQDFFIKNYTNGSSQTHALLKTSDSMYVQAGKTNSEEILVYKSNRFGDTLWMHTYGGNQSDEAIDIVEAATGGYVLVGNTSSFGAGGSDIFLMHIDTAGIVQWTQTYGVSLEDNAFSLMKTSDDGYIITGRGSNFNSNALLLKTDASGTLLWSQTYTSLGLSRGKNIVETNDNGFLLVGRSLNGSMKVVKLDSIGNTDWARSASPVWQFEMQAMGIIELSNGNFAIFGDEQGPRLNIFVMTIDPIGNLLWGRVFRQNTSSFDWVHDAIEAPDGGLVLSCGFEMSRGLAKLTSSGNLEWAWSYNGVEMASSGYDYRGKMFTNWAGGYLFSSNAESGIISTDSLGRVPCYGFGSKTLGTTSNTNLTSSTVSSSSVTLSSSTVSNVNFGNYSMTRFEFPDFPSINPTITPDNCTGIGEIDLAISNGVAPYQIDWNSGCTGTICSNLESGSYPVIITDDIGCMVNEMIEVTHEADIPEICMVTVDSLSQFIKVIWETPTVGHIDTFNIYRESFGTPVLIGSVTYGSPGIHDDLSGSLSPNASSYRYSLTTQDTCGYESQYSVQHKSILCGVSSVTGSTTTLQWNLYEGTTIAKYRIYRDILSNNTWELIDSVDANTNTYTDFLFSASCQYRIEAVLDSPCNISGQIYGGSLSNIARVEDVGMDELTMSISVAPNPADTYLNISNSNLSDDVTYSILNSTGRIVTSNISLSNTNTLDISYLSPGMYILVASDQKEFGSIKFVKK